MRQDFIDRGYPENLVTDAARRARDRNRPELLSISLRGEPFKGITTAFGSHY